MTQHTIESIYKVYSPKLKMKFSKSMRDDQDIEDLVQETLIKVNNNLPTYDSTKGAISTWIYRIATNVMIDHFKARSKQPITISVPILSDNENTESLDSPENILSAEQSLININKAASLLSTEFLEVYRLRAVEGFSTKETADQLGIALGTAKSRYKRAKDSLQGVV
jgi:RNA polymerase sigma factor (sigma-70 family)